MMTLKHITPGGHESVTSLVSVSYDPETNILIGHGTPSGDVEWRTGRAYVMNAHGKTVAAYSLDSTKEQNNGNAK